jgi:5'-nucleotidase
VRLALTEIMPDADFLLSGINRGGNLGADIYISGTVAAARESTLMGCPAMAISQYVGAGREIQWPISVHRIKPVIANLLAAQRPPHAFWNINLPHPPDEQEQVEATRCPVDFLALEIRFQSGGDGYAYAGNYHKRPRTPGHDVDTCFSGQIAVSLIPLQLENALSKDESAVAIRMDRD